METAAGIGLFVSGFFTGLVSFAIAKLFAEF